MRVLFWRIKTGGIYLKGDASMYKQVIRKSVFILSTAMVGMLVFVLSINTSTGISIVEKAQAQTYQYCYGYCAPTYEKPCQKCGFCLLPDGSSTEMMCGYHAPCCP